VVAPVDRLRAVAIPGDREEHLGLELTEAVEDALDPELGRARCPDRAEARRREEGDERLGDVRQVRDDPVAGTDAEAPQTGARACHLRSQVAEGELHRLARLRVRDHRNGIDVLVAAEHVLGEVQPRAREPVGTRHLARAEHSLVRHVRANLVEVPDRGPERLEVRHRPAPQLLVTGKVEAPLGAQPLEVAAELEPLARIRRRCPQHVAVRQRPTRPRAHRRDPRLLR